MNQLNKKAFTTRLSGETASKMADWDSYLDKLFHLADDYCDKGAIITLDGGIILTSNQEFVRKALGLTPEEAQKIASDISTDNQLELQQHGIVVNGTKYPFLKSVGDVYHAAKMGKGMLAIQKTSSVIVIAHKIPGAPEKDISSAVSTICRSIEEDRPVLNANSTTTVCPQLTEWDAIALKLVSQTEGTCDRSAIIKLDGGEILTTTQGSYKLVDITTEEAKKIADVIATNNETEFEQNGVVVGGIKYPFLRSYDDMYYSKAKLKGAITMQRTEKYIVIAHTEEGSHHPTTNKALAEVCKCLVEAA